MPSAREIAAALGGAIRSSGGWVCPCPVPTHGKGRGDRAPSLLIKDNPSGGLRLHCFAGCAVEDVRTELNLRGLIVKRGGIPVSRERSPEIAAKAAILGERSEPTDMMRIAWAKKVWDETEKARGTIVEKYLRGRGITIPVPLSLRFHPSLRHGPSKQFLPAMVGLIKDYQGNVTGVHRTYLARDGSGKADVSPNKMSLGAVRGSGLRLTAVGRIMMVGEGIETVLSVMQQRPDIPGAIVALNAPNLRLLVLSPEVEEVRIYADGDEVGIRAAKSAGTRWISEGRKVWLAPAPEGLDWNDVINNKKEVA